MTDASSMHPDVNALADLAADVLPVEEARAVEAHVIQCPDCADLLADSERIRPLLLSDDVGPMPDDVWGRLSGVLAEESAARSALGGHVVPMSPVPAPASAPWEQHWQVDGAAPSAEQPRDQSDTQWWAAQQDGWDHSPLEPGAAAAAAEGTVRDQHVPPAGPDASPLVRRRRDGDERLDQPELLDRADQPLVLGVAGLEVPGRVVRGGVQTLDGNALDLHDKPPCSAGQCDPHATRRFDHSDDFDPGGTGLTRESGVSPF